MKMKYFKLAAALIVLAVLQSPANAQFSSAFRNWLRADVTDTTTGGLKIQGRVSIGYAPQSIHATQGLQVVDSAHHAYITLLSKSWGSYPIFSWQDSTELDMTLRLIDSVLYLRSDDNAATIMSWNDATRDVSIPNGNLTLSEGAEVDGRDVSVDGAKLDGIESGATADQLLNEIGDPDGNTSIGVGSNNIVFNFANPASNGFELNATGVFSGDLFHAHQHTGNVGEVTLISAEAEDSSVTGLRVSNTVESDTLATFKGGAVHFDSVDIVGVLRFDGGTDASALADTQFVRDAVSEAAVDIDMFTGNVTFAGLVGEFGKTKRLYVDSAYIADIPTDYLRFPDYPEHVVSGDSLGMHSVSTHWTLLYHPMNHYSEGEDTLPFFGMHTPFPNAFWENPVFVVSELGDTSWHAFKVSATDSIEPPIYSKTHPAFVNTGVDSVTAIADPFLFNTLEGITKAVMRLNYANNLGALITTEWLGDDWSSPDDVNYLIDSTRMRIMGRGGPFSPFISTTRDEKYYLYFYSWDDPTLPISVPNVNTLLRWVSDYADSNFVPDNDGAIDDGYGADSLGGCFIQVDDSALMWPWHGSQLTVSPYQKILWSCESKLRSGGDSSNWAIRESFDGGRTWINGKVLLSASNVAEDLRMEGIYKGDWYLEDDHLIAYPVFVGEDTLINAGSPPTVHHVMKPCRVYFGNDAEFVPKQTDTNIVVLEFTPAGNADGAFADSFFLALPQFDLDDTSFYMLRDSAGPTMTDDTDFVALYWPVLPEHLIRVDSIIVFWKSAAANVFEIDTGYVLGPMGPRRGSPESAFYPDSVYKTFDISTFNVSRDSLKLDVGNTDFEAREPMALLLRVSGDAGNNLFVYRAFAICHVEYVLD